MRQMWLDFLMMPPTGQFALIAAAAFLGSFCGLLLIISGRRAWYQWRLEVWRRQHPNLWPDGAAERHEAVERQRRRLNGLVEIRRERLP